MSEFIPKNQFEKDLAKSFDFSEMSESIFTDEISNTSVGEKFVVFHLNEKLFGISSKMVAEVARPLPVAALPNTPEWLLGIANLRGEIISVLNLPKILQQDYSTSSLKTKFVVLQPTDFAKATAFNVDRLSEIVTLNADEIELNTEESDVPHVFGKALHKSNTLHLIDADGLLSSLAF